MATLASLVVKIVADATAFQQGLASAQKAIGSFQQGAAKVGSLMADAGKKLTIGVTAPILGFGAAMVKTAADFESQMNVLQVAAGDSGVSLDQLRQAAIKVGADTDLVGISASEAAEAMTNFYKAGLDTNQIMGNLQGYLAGTAPLGGALRAAIDLAAASELDLAQASDLVITTMNTFGLSADEVVAKIGNYVQAADASVASVSDLQQAMINVGPTMAAFGFSMEDVNTALAILSTRGIVGAEAGTALKSMFTNLMRDTKEVKKALAELNVSLYDSEGNMKSMPQIVKELSAALDENAVVTITSGGASKEQARELVKYQRQIESARLAIEEYHAGARGLGMSEAERARAIEQLNNKIAFYQQKHDDLLKTLPPVTRELVKMTQAQRNQYIQTLAGTYGMKAMNTLMAEGAEGWEEMEKKIANAATMQESAAARTKGFNAAMEQLRGSVEAFMIQAGTPFIQNVLTPLIQRLTEVIGKLAQADPKFLQMILTIAGIVAVVGPALIVMGNIIKAIGTIGSAVSGLASVFGGLASAIGPAIGGVIAALGPILPIVLAVIAVIGLLYLAWKNNWIGIRDIAAKVGAFLKNAFQGVVTWLGGVWQRAKEAVVNALISIVASVIGNTEQAKQIVYGALENIKAFFASAWEWIKTAASAAWEALKGIIAVAWEFIKGYITAGLQILNGDWAGAWETIKATAVRVWEMIKTTITHIVGTMAPMIIEKISALGAWILEHVIGLKDKVIGAIIELKDKFIGIITGLADTVGRLIGGIWNKIFGGGGAATAPGGAAGVAIDLSQLEALPGQVSSVLEQMQSSVAAALTNIGTAITNAATTWQATLAASLQSQLLAYQTYNLQMQRWTQQLWLGFIVPMFMTVLPQLHGLFQATFFAIQTTVTNAAINAKGSLRANLLGMQSDAISIMSSMKAGVMSILNSMVEEARAAGAAMASAFGRGIRSKLEEVYQETKEMVERIRDLLPGSDAKEGPLSDLRAAGRALPQTLARGILAGQGALLSAANLQAANLARGVAMPEVRVAGVRGMAAAPSGGQNISVTINNPRGEPSEASITKQLRNLAYLGVLSPM